MPIRLSKALAMLPLMAVVTCANAFANSSPLGIWIDHTGKGAVEIKDCNGALCGHVVWTKSAADRSACNMQIIGGGKAVGAKWDGGWIYDPEAKEKYDVEITPVSENKLKVLGYSGVKMFGETMIWTRAPADLALCGARDATVAEAHPAAAPMVAPLPSTPPPTTPPADAVVSSNNPTTTADVPATKSADASPKPAETKPAEPKTVDADEDESELDLQIKKVGKGRCLIELEGVGNLKFPC